MAKHNCKATELSYYPRLLNHNQATVQCTSAAMADRAILAQAQHKSNKAREPVYQKH